MSSEFAAVTARLLLALDIPSDNQLAARLGMKQSTWSSRKTRGSLPTEAIARLIEQEQINPEFIYRGLGGPHLALDEKSWRALFTKRIGQVLAIKAYADVLQAVGHSKSSIKAVADEKEPPSMELLRDSRSTKRSLDLNWLICGELVSPSPDAERELLTAWRSADETIRALARRALGLK